MEGEGEKGKAGGGGGLAAGKEGLRRVAAAGKGRLEGGKVGDLGFWEGGESEGWRGRGGWRLERKA